MIYISIEDWGKLTELEKEGLRIQNDFEIVEVDEFEMFETKCGECDGTGSIESDCSEYSDSSPQSSFQECDNCAGGIVEKDYDGY